jgi:HAD superfamily hydrolase (TIGR01549 family)
VSEHPPLRAVLFDLDGTLYHQPPLRALMVLELATLFLRGSPASAQRTLRGLSVFRRVREELRRVERDTPLERLQYEAAARRAGVPAAELEAWAHEWIEERPLKHLRRCRRRGLVELLDGLRDRGLRTGVFSDHPVRSKLQALGVADAMELQLCATDDEIDAFKPDPRGFQRACELWGLEPAQVLYVGDRVEIDGAGAARAGMPCAILGRSPTLIGRGDAATRATDDPIRVSSLSELLHGIDRRRA